MHTIFRNFHSFFYFLMYVFEAVKKNLLQDFLAYMLYSDVLESEKIGTDPFLYYAYYI